MSDGSVFIASGVKPTCLMALNPAPIGVGDLSFDAQGTLLSRLDGSKESEVRREDEVSDATRRILKTAAEAFSRWFLVMRGCIQRERVRHQLFREEHGLPKSTRLPYERQPLTSQDIATASCAEAMVRCLFGDVTADYARDKFQHAIDTGDMRAFKIRLLLIKARDSLQHEHSPMHASFVNGLEDCIAEAETLAGCKPDPSPRRLSRVEQERKRKREEREAKKREAQPELPLQWPTGQNNKSHIQDIEQSKGCPDNCPLTEKNDTILDDMSTNGANNDSEIANNKANRRNDKYQQRNRLKESVDTENADVTVTTDKKSERYGNGAKKKQGGRRRKKPGVVRKAREYRTVEQILDDIEEGKIVPYESVEEICADVKAGLLTPVEALMFTNALDRYSPPVDPDSDEPVGSELEDECVGGVDGDDDDEDAGEDEHDDGGWHGGRDHGSFSYNPRGFAGCRVADSDEDCGQDDQW